MGQLVGSLGHHSAAVCVWVGVGGGGLVIKVLNINGDLEGLHT